DCAVDVGDGGGSEQPRDVKSHSTQKGKRRPLADCDDKENVASPTEHNDVGQKPKDLRLLLKWVLCLPPLVHSQADSSSSLAEQCGESLHGPAAQESEFRNNRNT